MPNLSALAPITTAAQALSNLILATPGTTQGYQPQNPPNADGTPSTAQQPPAFLFHYEGENSAMFESDITDHYVEDNTAIQDQIALKPEMVTTAGFIGELNNVTPTALKPIKFAADKLTVVGSYLPAISVTAQIAYNEAFLLYQTGSTLINSAVSAWNSISGAPGQSIINGQGLTTQGTQNKQQSAFQQWYGYWRNRTLFTIQTPWAVFQNMAIKSLHPVQDAETDVITEFSVVFKIIRTAKTAFDIGLASTFQTRGKTQSSDASDLGTSAPVASIGLTDGLTSMGVA
jgi:hypothetical protein